MSVDIYVRREQSNAIDTGFSKKRAERMRREAIRDFTDTMRELIFAWLRIRRAGLSQTRVQP
jgi:hypothetical protein